MAATVLVREVLYRVSAQLLDMPTAAEQFTRWPEQELVHWLNDGQAVIAKYLPPATSRVDAIKLAAGSKQSIESIAAASILPGDGSAAAAVKGKLLLDVIRNMGADGATPGRAIRVVARDVLDAANPNWHTTTDTTVTEYVFDPKTPKVFYVSPAVAPGASLWIEIAHLVNPVKVVIGTPNQYRSDSSDATTISIDDQFVDDLVNYIIARAQLKDAEAAGNLEIARAHINLFTSGLNAQALALTGVNPNLRMLPMAPALGTAT